MKRKIDPREVQRYLAELVTRAEKVPDSMGKYELRLVTKYKKMADATQNLLKDLQDLDNQIKQGQARLRSMELQAENCQGSVNMLVEELMDLKLEAEASVPPEAPVQEGQATSEPVSNEKPAKSKHNKRTP